jgi:hypothetical protein
MQVTDEVTSDEKQKILIWIGRNQGNQSDSETFHEYWRKRKKLKLMKLIYFLVKPDTTIKDLFRIRRIQLYSI